MTNLDLKFRRLIDKKLQAKSSYVRHRVSFRGASIPDANIREESCDFCERRGAMTVSRSLIALRQATGDATRSSDPGLKKYAPCLAFTGKLYFLTGRAWSPTKTTQGPPQTTRYALEAFG
jgi:hypothetical protein